jgi:capsular polysaccharide biosynthesis protein
MDLISNADVLMGVHGAGLTNMLACKSDCRIIELRGSQDTTNNCFFSLASALELDYYYFMTKENPTATDKVGNVDVDPVLLRDFLLTHFPFKA